MAASWSSTSKPMIVILFICFSPLFCFERDVVGMVREYRLHIL
jgi:hypothetical protein